MSVHLFFFSSGCRGVLFTSSFGTLHIMGMATTHVSLESCCVSISLRRISSLIQRNFWEEEQSHLVDEGVLRSRRITVGISGRPVCSEGHFCS